MYVVCIFPIITNERNIPKILEIFRDHIAPTLEILGADKLDLRFPQLNFIYVPTSASLKGEAKGEGILGVLKNVPGSPDYVIICDGSGKIPYTKIIDVFRELVSDSSTKCVMTERVGENKAISKCRFLIECWEVYLLQNFFKHPKEIPDGQCGLWGYYANEFTQQDEKIKIKLTAEGYDIELDLLSEILEKGIDYTFIPLTLPDTNETTHSSFEADDNIKKMKFLINKHPKIVNCLKDFLQTFCDSNKLEIDTLNKEEEDTWNDYIQTITNLNN